MVQSWFTNQCQPLLNTLLGPPASRISISYELTGFFHGGNTGSSPVGDANNLKDVLESSLFAEGLKGFDKKKSLAGRAFLSHLFCRQENHFDELCLRRTLHRSDGLRIGIGCHLVVRMA